ncbi:hypothetical protein [Candidatus Leptofilum sp.]|uniref:hypothetical protein n=1 Tax=Candidatus Leptofilum sp. TaxID=3241576 RepID=UPI003B5BF380
MPEYHRIEMHQKLESKNDFPVLLKKFENFLSQINLLNEGNKDWLKNISWDVPQDGFVYSPNAPEVKLHLKEVSITARPSILGITSIVMPELKDNWVSFNLSFPSSEIDDLSNFPTVRYYKKPIKAVLQIIEFAACEFTNLPIFLTNEAQHGQPWLGKIQNNHEKLWFFELGNVPSTFEEMVARSNNQFHIWIENQRTWFANKQVFPDSPWN